STKHLTIILHSIGDRGRNSNHGKHLPLLPLPTADLGLVSLSCSYGVNFPSRVDNIAQKNRSRSRSCGRLTLRLRTISCWRRARISVASARRAIIRQRKRRRKAEKRNIKEQKIIELERDVRKRRMMEIRAKCKYFNGGRNIREGQVLANDRLTRQFKHDSSPPRGTAHL